MRRGGANSNRCEREAVDDLAAAESFGNLHGALQTSSSWVAACGRSLDAGLRRPPASSVASLWVPLGGEGDAGSSGRRPQAAASHHRLSTSQETWDPRVPRVQRLRESERVAGVAFYPKAGRRVARQVSRQVLEPCQPR
ncbi:hypothetical protein L596_025903 [Steinernema carpocapsae]|uniref:Uncharacterized protein n=1 Tax=Steinernema carpocapsae TaxID=34508 RepID=A0A4U5M954_STECR|nr:hypothetical protein L596_025903 [Steinernema carpocapsae]